MNINTRFILVITTLILIVGISACDQLLGILSDNQIPEMDGKVPQLTGLSGEIPIGIVLPLTGRFISEYGYLPTQLGAELALNEINTAQLGDARIRFVAVDDGGTVEGTVEAFGKLIHQHGVPVILGPGLSSQAEKAFPIAQENQVVAFSATSSVSGLSAIGDYIFRVSLTNDVLIPSGIKATRENLGYQRVAMIYDETDLYSTDNHDFLREILASHNVEVLARETFEGDEDDFFDQLTRIKALNSDAVFVSALSLEISKILIQGREVGIPVTVPFIVPDFAIDEVRAAGLAAEGVITFSGWSNTASTPGNHDFIRNYLTAYDVEASIWAAHAYATVYVLAEAIANAQSTDATAIRDAMADIKDLDSILGKFSFDDVGDAVYEPLTLVVANGQFEVFE